MRYKNLFRAAVALVLGTAVSLAFLGCASSASGAKPDSAYRPAEADALSDGGVSISIGSYEDSAEASKAAPSPAGAPVPGGLPASPGSVSPSGTASTYGSGRSTLSASGLKAGYSDDNEQFNYFVEFLQKYSQVEHYPYDISERITVKVLDSAGKSVSNAAVTVQAGSTTRASGLSYANGEFRFFPSAFGSQDQSWTVSAQAGKAEAQITVSRDGPRSVEIRLAAPRSIASPVPLDVLFIMDTTGSMGEEIERLRDTIAIIYANLNALKPRPLVRFGLVLYKDRGDSYITELHQFTQDLDAFQKILDGVYATGGGDGPEDLESALDAGVNKMNWNKDGIRLAFVVTDAEAHLDYGRDYTYIHAANDARAKAIKLYTIGTGGLPLEGEYLLRQVSQLTSARYIFLTYGEKDESSGGTVGSVSHHTGSNFTTDKLEAIIIRFVKDEVAFLSDTPPVIDESFFTADSIDSETRDATLDKLFAQALGNLADYSTFKVDPSTLAAVIPMVPGSEGLSSTAEYFTARLNLAAAVEPRRFKLVERVNLQAILEELELQMSGLTDEATVAKVGKLMGAQVLITGTLYKREERYELFLKLVRVSTAEVLAVTRAKIDLNLGL